MWDGVRVGAGVGVGPGHTHQALDPWPPCQRGQSTGCFPPGLRPEFASEPVLCDPRCSEASGLQPRGGRAALRPWTKCWEPGFGRPHCRCFSCSPGGASGSCVHRVMGPVSPLGQGGGLRLPGGAAWHLQRAPSSARFLCGPSPRTGSAGELGRQECLCVHAAALADSGLPWPQHRRRADLPPRQGCAICIWVSVPAPWPQRPAVPGDREVGPGLLPSGAPDGTFLVTGSVPAVFKRGGRRSKAGEDTGQDERVNMFPRSCCNILRLF